MDADNACKNSIVTSLGLRGIILYKYPLLMLKNAFIVDAARVKIRSKVEHYTCTIRTNLKMFVLVE